jgi:hypothetical protein
VLSAQGQYIFRKIIILLTVGLCALLIALLANWVLPSNNIFIENKLDK